MRASYIYGDRKGGYQSNSPYSSGSTNAQSNIAEDGNSDHINTEIVAKIGSEKIIEREESDTYDNISCDMNIFQAKTIMYGETEGKMIVENDQLVTIADEG